MTPTGKEGDVAASIYLHPLFSAPTPYRRPRLTGGSTAPMMPAFSQPGEGRDVTQGLCLTKGGGRQHAGLKDEGHALQGAGGWSSNALRALHSHKYATAAERADGLGKVEQRVIEGETISMEAAELAWGEGEDEDLSYVQANVGLGQTWLRAEGALSPLPPRGCVQARCRHFSFASLWNKRLGKAVAVPSGARRPE